MSCILVLMSGGTTPVINATLVGILTEAKKHRKTIYTAFPGFIGLLQRNIVRIDDLSHVQLVKLYQTPSSCFTGTSRVERLEESEYIRIMDFLRQKSINTIINIGGNGTLKQSKYFSEIFPELKVISLPKTVDNDLGTSDLSVMYTTPGCPSAVNYWRHKMIMLDLESRGAFANDRVLIAQAFGRETGFLTAAMRYGDYGRDFPLVLLLPEVNKSQIEVYDKIDNLLTSHNRVIIGVSEGYSMFDFRKSLDESNQAMYGSSENNVAQLLAFSLTQKRIRSRTFIPGVDQRSNLVYALKSDRELAFNLGKKSIECIISGVSNSLISVGPRKEVGYEVVIKDFGSLPSMSRKLDEKFISSCGFDVSDEYLRYLDSVADSKGELFNSRNHDEFLFR